MSENIDDVPNVPPEGSLEGGAVTSDLLDLDREALEGASDVLLLGPMRGSLDDDGCRSLLGTQPVEGRNVLCVSLTQSAEERIDLLREGLAEPPARVCVVSGADRYPSETTTGADDERTTLSVSVVRDPSDLPRLGMTISRAVDDWEDDDALACFHSLTALLQYAEPQRVFRFVHLLQNRLDATTHYHMDAAAHDAQTVATLRPLFDAVVEYDADGNATVTD
jgi:hypothetical protein